VKKGNVREVMCAYQRFEGKPCCTSDRLLIDILRNKWGYDAIVLTDCDAINNFFNRGQHETHKDGLSASVDAVLNGTKTMTRRIIKCPKKFMGVEDLTLEFYKRPNQDFYFDWVVCDADGYELGQLPAPYEVGEVVAIAQSYHALNKSGFVAPEWLEHTCESSAGYENKMFVRADLMPHQIQITDVRVERLQDISDEDCLKEGIYAHTVDLDETPGVYPYTSYAYDARVGSNIKRWWYETPREAFHQLICKLSGKNVWIENPYVFVYSFKLIQ
jgi:hypothetical protein